MPKLRCSWATSPLLTAYHDGEWGVPSHDDVRLFEFLVLEGAQAGLSWETILKKRDDYRRAFDGFAPEKVAVYGPGKIAALLADAGIVRNRLKVEAAVQNARAFLNVQKEFGTFDAYLGQFVAAHPANKADRASERVTKNAVSDALSKDLRRRGFKFVGATIVYAFMQAVGLINDHEVRCYRRREIDEGQ